MKIKILIANSVGKDKEGNNYILFPSRWTANVGRAKSFNFYPYELAYLSSVLKREERWSVKMIDGNYEELGWEDYFEKYKGEKPDYLVMETSSVVYEDDLKFALRFKQNYDTKLIFCGQHATAFPKELISDGVDYVCIGEYEYTVLEIIKGINPRKIKGLFPNKRRELLDINLLPFPEDDDISRWNYNKIGGCDYKEIEFFASRGCMMNCVFCVARQTYYQQANFRRRNIQNIIEEIKYLKNKYPKLEGIFFDEENHNTDKRFVLELCQAIVDNRLDDLKYDAMCGYWTLDEEVLKAMKRAGYYKIRIGIESASPKVCRGMKKVVVIDKMIGVLKMAKKAGIRMYGTFTFGAPESTLEEDRLTLKLMEELLDKNLLYDFQASVCTPQPGTPFFEFLDKKGYLLTKDWRQYGGNTAVYEYPNYPKKEIESNMTEAYRLYLKLLIRREGCLKILIRELGRSGFKGVIIKAVDFVKNYPRPLYFRRKL